MKFKLFSSLYASRKQPLKLLLITCIVLLTLMKLSLAGKGFLAFPDELRYCASGRVLKDLAKLNWESAINGIFSTQARPGDAIVKTIPVAAQTLSAHFLKLYYYESDNSYPLFLFNFLVYCFILLVHFRFSKLVLKGDILALVSVLILSSLTNSYLYLRHALGYDTSLLIFYLVIYNLCSSIENNNLSFRKSTLLGVLSFFGYLVYPGYFPLFAIGLFLVFFFKLSPENWKKNFFNAVFYVFGGLLCLLFFELLSSLAHRSYIADARLASSVVTQGSAEESFTFLIKYFLEVEGASGIILSLGILLFCFFMFMQLKSWSWSKNTLILCVGVSVLGLFTLYASVGYFFHSLYLMGRSLHQYIPFIIILAVFSLDRIFNRTGTLKNYLLAVITLICVVGFFFNFRTYKLISYPRDLGWKLIKKNPDKLIKNNCEYEDSWSVLPTDEAIVQGYINKTSTDTLNPLYIVNSCYIYPFDNLSRYHAYQAPPNYTLVESKPHMINFKAYQYEGYNITERNNIDKMNVQIMIFNKTGHVD